jgi:hypothetical protein
MRILVEIFLGLLYFNFLIVCCLYFRKNNPLKQYEEQLNDLKTVESTK